MTDSSHLHHNENNNEIDEQMDSSTHSTQLSDGRDLERDTSLDKISKDKKCRDNVTKQIDQQRRLLRLGKNVWKT